MKRWLSILLCFIMIASALPLSAEAAYLPLDDSLQENYLLDQYYDAVWQGFEYNVNSQKGLWSLLQNEKVYAYVPFAESLKNDKLFRGAIKTVEVLTDNKLQDKNYIQILMTLLALFNSPLVDVLDYRGEYDRKSINSYVWDIAEILTGAAGADAAMKKRIESVWSHAAKIIDAQDIVLDLRKAAETSKERMEYVIDYATETLEYYESCAVFLNSIIKHTSNRKLRDATETILKGNSKVLAEKMQTQIKQIV